MFVNTELKDKCTCLCDFAKRCPLRFRLNTSEGLVHASVAGKKKQKTKQKQGACRLARCQQRAQAQTYPRVGGTLVLCQNQRGWGGEILSL